MHYSRILSVLFITAVSADSCGSDALDKGPVPISEICSNASLKEGWLAVDCDVGSQLRTFSVGLNYCIANYDGNIALAKDGMAMDSCGESCTATVTRGKGAKLVCNADNCKGEVDLDEAITFTGSYLTCGGHIGSSGEKKTKRVNARDL